MYEIEKGVRMPTGGKGFSVGVTGIIRKMEVGDSVVVESKKVSVWRECSRRIGAVVAARSILNNQHRIWLLEAPKG